MNPRKLYLASASAVLIGVGSYFLSREVLSEGVALSFSITSALAGTAILYVFASILIGRPTRAFLGLALVFGAVWFGVHNNMLGVAVLWAGILFGALDSLSKVAANRNVPVGLACEQDALES